MKRKPVRVALFISIAAALLAGCTPTPMPSSQEPSAEPSSSSQSSSSSKQESVASSEISSNVPGTSESSSSHQTTSEPSSGPSSEAPSSSESSFESIENPCDGHEWTETIVKKASIIEKGIKRLECSKCNSVHEETYYDLDEYVFEDATYMYDGKQRTLRIQGMLPYGVRAEYEDNTLTEIGSKEAKVTLYDENNQVLETKTATLRIVENIGLANVRIVTETGEDPDYKERDLYTGMTLDIDNCEDKYKQESLTGGIRIRGNSTNQDAVTKRPWRLKLDSKTNLLGLNGGAKMKSWVLLADYFDQSLLRNQTAFTLGNSLFNYSGNYCSDFKHVNLYMNGDYRGVYLLAEQQQANKNRINIAEPEDGYEGTDVGYLVELDGLANKEDYYFTVGEGGGGQWGGMPWGGGGEQINGVSIPSKDYAVKTDVYGEEQLPFISKYVTNVFTILKNIAKGEALQVLDENNDLIDSPYATSYETLNAVMDVESIFKTFVLNEYMRNYDVGWGSFYFYVDFSKKSTYKRLTLGAPWDFDWSTGNANNGAVNKSTGRYCFKGEHSLFNPWLYLLSQTDFFQDRFEKYYSVFASSGIIEHALENIEYESSAFATQFNANYDRWGTLNGQQPTMYTRTDVVSKFTCHQDAADFLLNWMRERKTYMDETYLNK